MKKCIDCGDAPVNHTAEWVSAVVDRVDPFGDLMDGIWKRIEPAVARPLYHTIAPFVMNALVAVGLATYADKPDEKTGARTRVMWEEALRRGIWIREFRLFWIGRNAFIVKWDGENKVFLDLPRPGDFASPGLIWMGDKEILRERLEAAGIPVPKGGVATSVQKALALFGKLGAPVITKPETGSRSRHTTTHIDTPEALTIAFKKAAVLSPWVVIEEEENGYVYRGTAVGGKLVAVLRREPPMVIGDGEHTVSELIAAENKNPRRDGTIFHQLQIDEEAREELKRQNLSIDSVPAKGQEVTLSQKATRGIGGGTTDMTDVVHPDIKNALESAAQLIDDPLMGFDFMFADITKSWKDQSRGGIIEANSLPFIDLHHYPLVGEPRNVAGALWDLVFPGSNK